MADAPIDNAEQRATVTIDAQGFFKSVSPQLLSLLGRPVESLAGVSLTDLIHPNDAAQARQLFATAAQGSAGVTTLHVFVAGERWLPMRVTAASAPDGRILLELVSAPATPDVGAAADADGARVPNRDVASESDRSGVLSGDIASDTPHAGGAAGAESSSAHAARFPGPEVPDHRAAIRDSLGESGTPLLELDTAGRPTHVSGSWSELSSTSLAGADVYVELVVASGQADEIQSAVDATVASATTHRFVLTVDEVGERWLHIVPIPSPHYAGVVHALVAVSQRPDPHDTGLDAVRPPSNQAPPTTPLAPEPRGQSPSPQPSDEDVPAGLPLAPSDEDVPAGLPSSPSDEDVPAGLPLAPSDQDVPPGLPSSPSDEDVPAASPSPQPVPRPPTTQESVELLQPTTRRPRLAAIIGVVAGYLALQGLYLGPAYDWPSPLQGLLDSQECFVGPLCDNEVLRFNHLAVLSLVVAFVAAAIFFIGAGPRRLVTDRPDTVEELHATSWRFDRRGPGVFAWLCALAVAIVSVQTIFTDSVSTLAWITAIGCGAVAAWRSDRDALVPLGASMAALALAVACLLVPVGIGSVWLGERVIVGLLILAVGIALLAYAFRLLDASDSSFDRMDFAAMIGFAVLALVLGLLRHHSWRYAFIGDEWSFYEGARDGLRGNSRLATFDIGGPNNYFTGLTFELQAAIMRVAGDDVWGWRLSSLMPMVLSVAAMYAFTRWLAGRTAALVAALALAAGHMLLSFSMVGYNNSQSLVAVSASFAALAWAHQRPSALRFFILGAAVGSTFLVYAMARLALIPLGLLFLVLFRESLVAFKRRLVWAGLGGLAVAAPALFSWENWEALLKATPVEAEDAVLASGSVGRQIAENTLAGWLSFIGSTRNSHFIVGPHLDVISAILLIVGVGYAIARLRGDRALRWFLVGGVALWTSINAIQQYAQISNTRSFMIPLVYCVFIGIGAAAVLPMVLARVPSTISSRQARFASVAMLGFVIVALNQWHIGSYANERQGLTEQAVLVQQFELTESIGGQGMQVFVGWPEEGNARLNMVLRAHDISPERIVVIPREGALYEQALCATDEPRMLVMHRGHPQATAWSELVAACWESSTVEVTDPAGGPKLLRTTNAAGAREFLLAGDQRVRNGAATDDYRVEDTIDVAVDGSGVGFALSRPDGGIGQIHRLGEGGSFDLVQRQVVDFDITIDGLFVVAANGGDDRLVWYDGAGNVVNRWSGQDELPVLGGVAVDGAHLWVSDVNRSRLLSFDASFKLDEIRAGEGMLADPGALAAGPDRSVWVANASLNEIVLVDAADVVSTTVSAAITDAVGGPRMASTSAGLLIRTLPERPAVELIAPDGVVIDVRAGVNRPRAAASRSGELLVADSRWNDVAVIAVDDTWLPAVRSTIAWGSRSISSDGQVMLTSPFISDDLLEPGPIAAELVETEAVEVAPGQIWRPIGVQVLAELQAIAAADDGAYAADVTGRIVRLDAAGRATAVAVVGASGSTFITDLAVDETGAAWALDAGNGQLHRIAADGQISTINGASDVLRNARGLDSGTGESVWVASTASAQLTQIASDGSIIATLALPGRQPSDVAVAPDGSFWFVDAQDIELVHVSADGVEIASLPLDAFSSAESPHLTIADERLWVTEPENSAIFAVDLVTNEPTGERTELLRESGTSVRKPIGMSSGVDGRLWVADSIGGAVIIVSG